MTSTSEPPKQYDYIPVQSHWFYLIKQLNQITWMPFSLIDVQRLEEAYAQHEPIVSTDGNRFDVNLTERTRTPVYWTSESNEVRRSKWFHSTSKQTGSVPFDQSMDETLENLYQQTCHQQSWPATYEISNGGKSVTFSCPDQMIMHDQNNSLHAEVKLASEVRVLKRGLPTMFANAIPVSEKDPVQHLCFVVHGIGGACDMKFRPLVECVEDFRRTSQAILQSHFKPNVDNGDMHRVEFLPVYWHADLHLDSTGVDNHLLPLTLPSAMKLRTFINSTLADVLLYTSPVYCQRIITRCIHEMNRLYELFLQRNVSFRGQISVIGHSLGSVILYDILNHQVSPMEREVIQKSISPVIQYEKLKFLIAYFFALGSPIALFLTIRGTTSIAPDFILPTCQGLLNIFHPYDPIAYRLEPLIDPEWTAPPVLLAHHKGRKRIHLEFADGLSRAARLKEKMFGVWKDPMATLTSLMSPYTNTPIRPPEPAMDDQELHAAQLPDRPIGKLNRGHRIDYVLQQRPVEAINEYLFAFASHVSYWTSEDTMLLILKEILRLDGYEAESRCGTIDHMIQSTIDLFRPKSASNLPS